MTRRDFIAYFGGLSVAGAAVYALPEALRSRSWWSAAYADDAGVVLDTFNGLAAMLWPGDDAYSVAQGESSNRPGAIAANAGYHTMVTLDGLVPVPATPTGDRGTVPLSSSVASAINSVAVTVNPAANRGAFPSPFARLRFAEKAAVWRRLEEETRQVSEQDQTYSLGVLQFVFGILPGVTQFLAFSEIDVFDPSARQVTRRPGGWDHAVYGGTRLQPVEGWDDFRGYYQGRKEVQG